MNNSPITRYEPVLMHGTIGGLTGAAIAWGVNYLLTGNDFSYFPVLVVVGLGMGPALGMHFVTKDQPRTLILRIVTTLIALSAAAAFIYYVVPGENLYFSIVLIAGAGITAWMASKEGAIHPDLFGDETQK